MQVDARTLAFNWLNEHGYAQFNDGTWQYKGYEADAWEVLTEFIETSSAGPSNVATTGSCFQI